MAVTILEALQNANYNLDNMKLLGMSILPLVKEQVNNAVVLLDKGYSLDDEVDTIIEKYGDIKRVPYIED
jgi:hypothetical protein